MRVLLATDFYHPLVGGVEQHVRTLGAELARTGHEVTVATLAVDGLATDDVDGDVRVVRVPSSAQRMSQLFSQPRTWATPTPDPETFRALRRLVREWDPDIIHGHDWMARSALPLRGDAAPFVSSLHYYTRSCARKDLLRRGQPCEGPQVGRCLTCAADHYGRLKGPPIAIARALGSRIEDRSAAAHIAVSRATAIGNGLNPDGDDVFVIPNFLPVDSETIDSGAHQLLDSLPNAPFLAYVGDFRPIKGFDLLLDAYERSAIDMPLVAIGKTWPETRTDLPAGVRVVGPWPNAVVRQALARAAFAVVPSMWEEPFGIVAIEALAGGTPVVAADVGGLGEIIDASTGITFPRGDLGALADALERMAGDADLRDRLGANSRAVARTYRADSVVPRIVQVYEKVRR